MKKIFIFFIALIINYKLFAQSQRVASELFNQGLFYLDNKDFVKANEKLKSATAILEKELNQNDTSLADCVSYLAYSYLMIDKKVDALKYYTKAYRIYNSNNKEQHLNYQSVL